MKRYFVVCFIFLFLLSLATSSSHAATSDVQITTTNQEETTIVPDVTGLNGPEAAAVLNAAGLRLGQATDGIWSVASATPPDVIGEQSVAAGETVALGTTIDVTILRTSNALLIFDDNDITLVNQSGQDADLTGLRFTSLDGATQAEYIATTWRTDTLRPGRCAQLWSVGRNGPKGLEECQFIQAWRSMTDAGAHFWTGTNGATQFQVAQNGISRAVCTIAERRCEFYINVPSSDPSTPYVYLAYATDQLIVFNNADNAWMPLDGITILNRRVDPEGLQVPLSDTSYFPDQNIIADVERLAPGQCLLFVTAPGISRSPMPCDVVGTSTIPATNAFWTFAFDVESVTDDLLHTCPAATGNNLTLCVMPR